MKNSLRTYPPVVFSIIPFILLVSSIASGTDEVLSDVDDSSLPTSVDPLVSSYLESLIEPLDYSYDLDDEIHYDPSLLNMKQVEKRDGMWKFRGGKRAQLWKFRGGKRQDLWKFRAGKRGNLWKFRGGKRGGNLWKFRGGKRGQGKREALWKLRGGKRGGGSVWLRTS